MGAKSRQEESGTKKARINAESLGFVLCRRQAVDGVHGLSVCRENIHAENKR